jgi:PAS domain S-box-containing protein
MSIPTLYVKHSSGEDGSDLEALLEDECLERWRLQSALDLRNCALDSASTHFMILNVARSPWMIIYANRAVAKDHGYERAELLGASPGLLAPASENPVAFERLNQAVREGGSVSIELIARRKDGATFSVGIFFTPVHSSAGVINHYLAIGADITARLTQERTQRELQDRLDHEMQECERLAIELRLAQKLESVGRLAVGIAHELNTPIQNIGDSVAFLLAAQSDFDRLLGAYRAAFEHLVHSQKPHAALALIEQATGGADLGFLNTEIPKAFQRTMEAVERVAAMVGALREFAHPGAVEHALVDLNHAIETTLIVARNEYEYSARIDAQLGDLPPVMCNVGELHQVFLNLVVNATHAIDESGKDAQTGRITITTEVCADRAVISVADNGCGISEENREKIFDPFFTTKPVGRSTGQGLAIARSIVVEKHGGELDVESVLGRGTRFILRLPIAGRR